METRKQCPDCQNVEAAQVNRRQFVQTVSAGAALVSAGSTIRVLGAEKDEKPSLKKSDAPQPEALVVKLYESLSPDQKKAMCYAWDYVDPKRGLLRSAVANNWNVNEHMLTSGFYTKDQQDIIEAIFYGLYHPDFHDKIKKQLLDDAGGYGDEQSIALFGEPGSGKFQFLMTGRHLTIRCDGDSADHVAFGGPIFYGHAADGNFDEEPTHPNNVYWYQAQKANALYAMLDGAQRKKALVEMAPPEGKVQFRDQKEAPGIPIVELTSDQKTHVQEVAKALLDPYRVSDRDELQKCLEAQGGLDACRIAFFQSGDVGNDQVWDIWRLEGPSFVWHYRGAPHVHVWLNVADDPSVRASLPG